MARRTSEAIPPDLRARLETARLDLLALFRALDRINLTPQQIPQRLLRQLFELDADYVEALWGSINRGSSTCTPCCAILWPHWSNYPQPAPDYGRTFHPRLTSHSLNLNSPSARS
jgi:hypothetical protein